MLDNIGKKIKNLITGNIKVGVKLYNSYGLLITTVTDIDNEKSVKTMVEKIQHKMSFNNNYTMDLYVKDAIKGDFKISFPIFKGEVESKYLEEYTKLCKLLKEPEILMDSEKAVAFTTDDCLGVSHGNVYLEINYNNDRTLDIFMENLVSIEVPKEPFDSTELIKELFRKANVTKEHFSDKEIMALNTFMDRVLGHS